MTFVTILYNKKVILGMISLVFRNGVSKSVLGLLTWLFNGGVPKPVLGDRVFSSQNPYFGIPPLVPKRVWGFRIMTTDDIVLYTIFKFL